MAANNHCPRTGDGLDRPQTRSSIRREMSADSPQTRPVRDLESAASAIRPQTRTGNGCSASLHHCVHCAAGSIPDSRPNLSASCPRLTQPQFDKRSRNLRRAVQRSSRICSRQRKSSPNSGKSGHHIVRFRNFSRSIACRRARRPSLRSVIKFSVRLSARIAAPVGNVRRRPPNRAVE